MGEVRRRRDRPSRLLNRGPGYRRVMDDEELAEKKDQELIELLNEIRVGLSGATGLFGFRLIVPLSPAWDERRGRRRRVRRLVPPALLSVVGLMGPTAYHGCAGASGTRSGCCASRTS